MLGLSKINVKIGDKKILDNFDLNIKKGEVHILMGPNGCGKSTLSHLIMGNPKYDYEGDILLNDKNINGLSPDKRAKVGLFLSFQHPVEITGINMFNYLRNIYKTSLEEGVKPLNIIRFKHLLQEYIGLLNLDPHFLERDLNKGFSGGEKKKSEIIQFAILKPKIAILDEIDSGLDVDALKAVSELINKTREEDSSLLIITHYPRILKYIHADKVHLMKEGRIIKSQDKDFAHTLEEEGFNNN